MGRLFAKWAFRFLGVNKLYDEVVQQDRLRNINPQIRNDLQQLLESVTEKNAYFRGRFDDFLNANRNADDEVFLRLFQAAGFFQTGLRGSRNVGDARKPCPPSRKPRIEIRRQNHRFVATFAKRRLPDADGDRWLDIIAAQSADDETSYVLDVVYVFQMLVSHGLAAGRKNTGVLPTQYLQHR